ncbi:MAG: dephospho-CoA kinase [Actinomycetota bacterium]
MILVGLTGGIGSGKTTVAGMLAARGAVVVDADELAREALEPGTRAFKHVCDLFGEEILTRDGRIDRAALARVIFSDEERRRSLESILHPEVFRLLAEAVERFRDTDEVVVFDAPLIIETGFHEAVDVLVVVTAPVEQRMERVRRDRGMSEAEAAVRIAAQAAPEARDAAADVLIHNDGNLEELENRVDELWADLSARSKR